jgi:transcriptional regulator with XRE-family HTH domain
VDKRSASSIDRRIGQRVRARRLELAMSQETLAELLGVTFQQVQKYEKGVNRIAAGRLYDMAGALGLPIEAFFENFAPAKPARSRAAIARATPGADELVALFARISDAKKRRRVISLVRAMADEEI